MPTYVYRRRRPTVEEVEGGTGLAISAVEARHTTPALVSVVYDYDVAVSTAASLSSAERGALDAYLGNLGFDFNREEA